MNNREYLQYEGASLVEEALRSFTSPAKGSDLYPILCESGGFLHESPPQSDDFFWDYVLLRLYLAEQEIHAFRSGFGCLGALVEGMEESLSHLPETLHALSLRRQLNGSFLSAGSLSRYPDRESVDRRFHFFRTLQGDQDTASFLRAIAKERKIHLSEDRISLLLREIQGYLSFLHEKLCRFTPREITRCADTLTPVFSFASGAEELADSSLLAFLTGLALYCLIAL